MSYSTPRTWVAGEYPTAAEFNQDIRDNISFLANPPACRAYHNAAQSIPNNADTTVAFNSERFDTATMHDTVTNNSRITIPIAGLYLLTFTGEFVAAADYQTHYAFFMLNGTTPIGVGTAGAVTTAGPGCLVGASAVYKFAAGNYVEVKVRQNNSAAAARNLNSSGNYSPEFTAVWLGLG